MSQLAEGCSPLQAPRDHTESAGPDRLPFVLGLEGWFAADMTDLVDRQAEVRGDLLIQSERIPAIEDDLLDDRPISVCEFLAHVGNVPSHTRRKNRNEWGYVWVVHFMYNC